MNTSNDWLLLVLTLPTDNATARMRFWRALKAKGCAVLRDGVYLLPATDTVEAELQELGASIGEAGGAAHLVRAPSRGADQEAEFRSLFDRADEYAAFIRTLADARKTPSDLSPAEITRLLKRAGKDFETISSIDFFRNEASTRAEAAWQDFVALANTVLSPGEPHQAEGAIRRLRREDYQGRPWATRANGCGSTASRARGSFSGSSILRRASCGLRRPVNVHLTPSASISMGLLSLTSATV